ncbi:glycoside hydrolase family 15 protein [Pararhodospirillum oryzae]|uniref:Glucoamylase n=1 Tax=Pararhodospirillum oryzae TaxID=478448 RepID=A0A512H476_9PROT|nr:glycoside hydrolase family 15 protein [Pararhodospirillum oryzae]GEO80269.1 glucoamylase [Pararhodospirillum oryzae]
MNTAAWGTLDLSPIGNCSVNALIDAQGRYVWACLPRPDGDPFFSALLGGIDPGDPSARGVWDIAIEGGRAVDQGYLRNTAVLRTVLRDDAGATIEILDFCPRFARRGRTYRPVAFARLVRPLSGSPRLRVRLRPTTRWGAANVGVTSGSNHIRYVAEGQTMRLTTNAPVTYLLEERPFRIEHPLAFFLGPDESFADDLGAAVEGMHAQTVNDWRLWVRGLALPLEWQDAVIRAAIGLKLCWFEETGALLAALTTSIPEAPNTGRTWDYRYCWLRDAYYVVQALNRLGAVDVLEGYLAFLRNLEDASPDGTLQPVYGLDLESTLDERQVASLPGYRAMGPVRVGNDAYRQKQHDVYGQVVLSTAQAFFDQRLLRPPTSADFQTLERSGEWAFALHDQPDAGLWELRTRAEVHTYSSVMCWAACDRLANVATHLGLPTRAAFWRERADTIADRVREQAWNAAMGSYVSAFGGDQLDASLLQMIDVRFIDPQDPRFLATLEAVGQRLGRGEHMLRYAHADDFGVPDTAFTICTFWYIEALARSGQREKARVLFERLLGARTRAGLLSEDIALASGTLWGNYPQTYSLVGLINAAVSLSQPWSAVR